MRGLEIASPGGPRAVTPRLRAAVVGGSSPAFPIDMASKVYAKISASPFALRVS
jgi:hypothetical protein